MIALDLDNTIICYDQVFVSVAQRLGCLPAGEVKTKSEVKAEAFARGGNDLWTELQGLAYGEAIHEARPYEGVGEFFRLARECGVPLTILSHKTEFAVRGAGINLRDAARKWLLQQGLGGTPVVFCDTREEKVRVLGDLACSALLDDLREVLETPGFPEATRFVLFDPANSFPEWSSSERVCSWNEAATLLLDSSE